MYVYTYIHIHIHTRRLSGNGFSEFVKMAYPSPSEDSKHMEHDSESRSLLRPAENYTEHDSESKSSLRPTSSSSPQRKEAPNLTSSRVGLNKGHDYGAKQTATAATGMEQRATAATAMEQRATAATAIDLRNPPRSGGVEKRIMEMMGEVCMYVCDMVCVYQCMRGSWK